MHNPFKFLSGSDQRQNKQSAEQYCWHLLSLIVITMTNSNLSVQESMSASELLIPHPDLFFLPFFFPICSRCAQGCSCNKQEACWCVILTHDPCESVKTECWGYSSPLEQCSTSHVDQRTEGRPPGNVPGYYLCVWLC